jgi:hypothetical protein
MRELAILGDQTSFSSDSNCMVLKWNVEALATAS